MKGFTLVETMVAITLLTIAIVAPMLLTVQSLASAYYARDQITASYLAQEAIEQVREVRDGQILLIAESSSSSGINIFGSIPVNQNFRIDAHQPLGSAITVCSSDNLPNGACKALQTNGTLYGYAAGWTSTNFTRTVLACYVQSDGSCVSAPSSDEMLIKVTVEWHTGSYAKRSLIIYENLYRWVADGSGA